MLAEPAVSGSKLQHDFTFKTQIMPKDCAAFHRSPVFSRLVEVNDGDVGTEHVYYRASVKIGGRKVVLKRGFAGDDCLVQLE
jgi:hypothetical protein